MKFRHNPQVMAAIEDLPFELPLWLVGLRNEQDAFAVALTTSGGEILAWDGWYGDPDDSPYDTYKTLAESDDWVDLSDMDRWAEVYERLVVPWMGRELWFHFQHRPHIQEIAEWLLSTWMDDVDDNPGRRQTATAEVVGLLPVRYDVGLRTALAESENPSLFTAIRSLLGEG
jgi:hypothetical protein